jgi:iron complex outermembrane recepter protein
MTPLRATFALKYTADRWESLLRVRHVATQDAVELNTETATPGHTLLDLEWVRHWEGDRGRFELTLAGQNLTDAEARNHLSFLKDVAPQPGRGIVLSLRWSH